MSQFLLNNIIAILALAVSCAVNIVVVIRAVVRVNKAIATRDQKLDDQLRDHEKRITMAEGEIKSLNPTLTLLSSGVTEVKTAIGFIKDAINRIDLTLNKQ